MKGRQRRRENARCRIAAPQNLKQRNNRRTTDIIRAIIEAASVSDLGTSGLESSNDRTISFDTFTPIAVKTVPDSFGYISLTKEIFRKYLKKNCSSELYLQLSFKYFVKSKLYSKVIFISMTDPDDAGQVNLKA